MSAVHEGWKQREAPITGGDNMAFAPLGNIPNQVWARTKPLSHTELETRIRKLEAALEECMEYFESRYDVVDGDYGQPRPNKEMQMGHMIDEVMGRRP